MTTSADFLVLGADVVPPWQPAPRTYRGCMGRIVPGVEFIQGAYPENPELVFSWLLHRYSPQSQAKILSFFKAAGDEDFLLSWPDVRVDGWTPDRFKALILKVRQAGFRPVVMLASKIDPQTAADVIPIVDPIIPVLKLAGVPRVCMGWELNIWLQPDQLQILVDRYASMVRSWGAFFYVHFTPGVPHWAVYPGIFADYWNLNVNKLRGLFHQKVTDATDQEYQTGEGGLRDILLHFNGGSGCTADSGDGTPFDLIALEINLELFSVDDITEAEMHRRGRVALATPPTSGPTGTVIVMGSGCGQ